MYTVELTPREIEEASRLGIARQRMNERLGLQSRRFARRLSDETIHVMGALAEFAVAKAEGLPLRCPLFRVSPADGRGPDVGRWQVKFTMMRPPVLAVPTHRVTRDRNFLLVVGGPAEFDILGWIPGDELFREENIRPFRSHDAYVAPWLYSYSVGGSR